MVCMKKATSYCPFSPAIPSVVACIKTTCGIEGAMELERIYGVGWTHFPSSADIWQQKHPSPSSSLVFASCLPSSPPPPFVMRERERERDSSCVAFPRFSDPFHPGSRKLNLPFFTSSLSLFLSLSITLSGEAPSEAKSKRLLACLFHLTTATPISLRRKKEGCCYPVSKGSSNAISSPSSSPLSSPPTMFGLPSPVITNGC